MRDSREKIAIIIGAGPAGLSAAYSLLVNTSNVKPIIIEMDSSVGGISKTLEYDGCKTDIGPHRFFTKDKNVNEFWEQFLPKQGFPAKDDILLDRVNLFDKNGSDPEKNDLSFLRRRRFSRIYYLNKFFDYPVKMNLTTILNLGLFRTFCCGISYVKSCVWKRDETSLEDFMINRFGKVLYSTFFEHYTQKVWGRHPSVIDKEWGIQRIKGLSLLKTLLNNLKLNKNKETSLIEEYYYPKNGSGQLWDRIADKIIELGGEIITNSRVVEFNMDSNCISEAVIEKDGEKQVFRGDYFISSMPIKDLIRGFNDVPNKIKTLSENLPYRDYMLVSFQLKDFSLKNNTEWKTINNICPDSWIYVQDRSVKIGRIYIPKNFSPYINKNMNDILIGLEYFCNENDELWNMSDEEMFNFAANELIKIKAIKSKQDIIKSYRYKQIKAYPAYFDSYKDFDKIKEFLNSIENLYCIGRNGQHKYNNMDHSTASGLAVVDIINEVFPKSYLWEINTEQKYQEVR